MINASPYDTLYIGTVYDHDDGHSIIEVWAVYAKTRREAHIEFRRRMREKGYDKVYKLQMQPMTRIFIE